MLDIHLPDRKYLANTCDTLFFMKCAEQAGTQVENEPAAYKGQKEITPIRGPFAAPAGLCPSLKKGDFFGGNPLC